MRISLFIFIICFSLMADAQQFNVTMTPEGQSDEDLLVKFEDGFFSFSLEMKGGMSAFSLNLKRVIHSIELKKYDLNLNLVQSVKLSGGEWRQQLSTKMALYEEKSLLIRVRKISSPVLNTYRNCLPIRIWYGYTV